MLRVLPADEEPSAGRALFGNVQDKTGEPLSCFPMRIAIERMASVQLGRTLQVLFLLAAF